MLLPAVKVCCAIGLFLEVVLAGRLVARLKVFRSGGKLATVLAFSGGLFLAISLLHIMPEAEHNFNLALSAGRHPRIRNELNQQWFLPYTQIIACATYTLVMLLDRVVMGDHHHDDKLEEQALTPNKLQTERNFIAERENNIPEELRQQPEPLIKEKNKCGPLVLQLGMSIHAFFECLAVGLQQSLAGTASLAVAIFVHKWAEGLTLGLMYEKDGYSRRTASLAVLFQGLVNVVGLLVGCLLAEQGPLVVAVFMSISAGTFLYISTGEVLPQQLKNFTKGKAIALFLSVVLVSSIFFIEQAGQHS